MPRRSGEMRFFCTYPTYPMVMVQQSSIFLSKYHWSGVFARNMLFLENVGQSVRANLPKLWRHLPPAGRDLQILPMPFFKPQCLLSERVGPRQKRSADCYDRSRYPSNSHIAGHQHLTPSVSLHDSPHPLCF